MRKLIDMDARDPINYNRSLTVAFGHFATAEYEDALTAIEFALSGAMSMPLEELTKAASLVELGRIEQARRIIQGLRSRWPDGAIGNITMPPYKKAENRARYLDALRQAGLPIRPYGRPPRSRVTLLKMFRSPARFCCHSIKPSCPLSAQSSRSPRPSPMTAMGHFFAFGNVVIVQFGENAMTSERGLSDAIGLPTWLTTIGLASSGGRGSLRVRSASPPAARQCRGGQSWTWSASARNLAPARSGSAREE